MNPSRRLRPASGLTSSRAKPPLVTSRLPSAVAVTNGWASTVTPRLQVVQPADGPLLPQEARVRPPDVGPGVGVAGALDHPGDVEAPGLRLASGIAETLERDPDLDLVAPVGDPPLRVPGEVGILVGAARNEAADLAGALAPNAVALGPKRVHAEEERPAAIVESVDVEDDVVVVVDVVAVGHGRTDRGGIAVVGDDAEVDRVRRIPHQDLGLLLGGPAVHRLVLPEAGQPGGLGPGGLVQLPSISDRGFPAAGSPRWASPSPRRRRRGGLDEQQQREHGLLGSSGVGRGVGDLESSAQDIYGKPRGPVSARARNRRFVGDVASASPGAGELDR